MFARKTGDKKPDTRNHRLQDKNGTNASPACISAEEALFIGDVIFNNGLGRTDLPGGNGEQLKNSIRSISAINAQWLLSGHGEPVAGAHAVKANFEQVERMWFPYI